MNFTEVAQRQRAARGDIPDIEHVQQRPVDPFGSGKQTLIYDILDDTELCTGVAADGWVEVAGDGVIKRVVIQREYPPGVGLLLHALSEIVVGRDHHRLVLISQLRSEERR